MNTIITAEEEKTVVHMLSKHYPETSQAQFRRWLEAKRIALNGFIENSLKREVSQGDIISILPRSRALSDGVTELYSDQDIIVIYKPYQLLSVALNKGTARHAHQIIKESYPRQRIYVVHRLDEGTSGVMLFCRTERSYEKLKEMFYHHNLQREYVAVVEGHLTEKKGVWKHRLIQDKNYHMHVTKKGGVEAITHYEVLTESKRVSLLKLTLHTGKKNQIRVQCSHEGIPIIGDKKYGSQMRFKRVCLHASDLVFEHPCREGNIMRFHLPLPGEFCQFVSKGYSYA